MVLKSVQFIGLNWFVNPNLRLTEYVNLCVRVCTAVWWLQEETR